MSLVTQLQLTLMLFSRTRSRAMYLCTRKEKRKIWCRQSRDACRVDALGIRQKHPSPCSFGLAPHNSLQHPAPHDARGYQPSSLPVAAFLSPLPRQLVSTAAASLLPWLSLPLSAPHDRFSSPAAPQGNQDNHCPPVAVPSGPSIWHLSSRRYQVHFAVD